MAFSLIEYHFRKGVKSELPEAIQIGSGRLMIVDDQRCIEFTVNSEVYMACSSFRHKGILDSDSNYVEYYYRVDDPTKNFLELKEDAFLAKESQNFVLPFLLVFGVFFPSMVKKVIRGFSQSSSSDPIK